MFDIIQDLYIFFRICIFQDLHISGFAFFSRFAYFKICIFSRFAFFQDLNFFKIGCQCSNKENLKPKNQLHELQFMTSEQ